MIGRRIRQLRLARGLSLEALASEMDGLVTKQALSKYEHGKSQPSLKVLNKLAAALKVKAAYLWNEPEVAVTFVAYRKKSRLPKREQGKIESLVRQSLEERIQLQNLINKHSDSHIPIREIRVRKEKDAERAAENLRDRWKLGQNPIASIVNVLEDHHIHVLKIDASENFDGVSAFACNDQQVNAAAVVTRRGVSGERQRLNLAHELGHLVLKVSKQVDEEKAAFRFGAAFLAPAQAILREVGERRSLIQAQELILLKQRFGLSIQALLYRLRDLEIITESYYTRWCMDINRLGWRKQEPLELPSEQPSWLRQSVLRAFSEGALTHDEAGEMMGEELETKESPPLVERSVLMKMPMDERRRILAEQARKMTAHFERNSEWKDYQGGDIVEY
jgi:Zn-dependent peptidase ImmA (M78 family)/DNA-binding XRE family transcriptional regulator